MKFTKTFTLAVALLLFGMDYAIAKDDTDMTGLVQKDFTKAYTGLENNMIINYRPKDCDFKVNQQTAHKSIFDKTNKVTTGDGTTVPE